MLVDHSCNLNAQNNVSLWLLRCDVISARVLQVLVDHNCNLDAQNNVSLCQLRCDVISARVLRYESVDLEALTTV